MTTTAIGIGAFAAFLTLAAGAQAQNTGPNPGSPLPGGGTTKDLTMPGQGGVAGTGLGGSTNGSGNGATSGRTSGNTAPGIPGTGESVKGPAGQGIDGQGIDGTAIPGGTGKPGQAGTGTGSSAGGSKPSGSGGAP